MSPYEVATIVLTGLIAAISWWNKVLWAEIKSLKDDMKDLPNIYARRDDLKDSEEKILRAIESLSNRIDLLLREKNG